MAADAGALPAAVCLFGPTASGKTEVATQLARRWPFEVISVDSALVYRGMDIGTAKPTAAELAATPHHLIDIRDPHQAYSAAEFRRDALVLMADIAARDRVPLLVGGTMLYFKVLIDGLADLPPADPVVRAEILQQAAERGWPALHQELARVDPQAAQRIHPEHSQRIQRALEVYRQTGRALSQWQAEQQPQPLPYRLLQLGLLPEDRSLLHKRIAERFGRMLDTGFVEELAGLRQRYPLQRDMPSMRAVGYRQAWSYLDGEIDREQLFEQGVAATRQLAKRQFTWLRKWPNVHCFDPLVVTGNAADSSAQSISSQIAPLIEELAF